MTSTLEVPTTNCTAAVSLQGVSKTYKHFRLENINLEVEPGTVNGLIGPNGAGKSTTMRIMMGLVNPDAGSVSLLGQPISSREAQVKQHVGYFSDDMRLYKSETIAWHLQLVRSFFPVWDDRYAEQLLERFGLIADQKVKGLSHGQRVKAMLLLILARHPKLLILDEPTNGLDPVAKQEVLGELMQIVNDESRTILFSSHNTQDVEQISDTITFIDRGRVIASNNRDEFLNQWRRFKVHADSDWQPPTIEGLHLESAFGKLRVFTLDRYAAEVESQLESSGATLEASEALTLEEIFIAAVARGRKEHRE